MRLVIEQRVSFCDKRFSGTKGWIAQSLLFNCFLLLCFFQTSILTVRLDNSLVLPAVLLLAKSPNDAMDCESSSLSQLIPTIRLGRAGGSSVSHLATLDAKNPLQGVYN